MKERLQYFDRMKGVAILMVVLGHITLFSFGMWSSSDRNEVLRFICIFNMPVFFYISGYFAYKPITRNSVAGKLKKLPQKFGHVAKNS